MNSETWSGTVCAVPLRMLQENRNGSGDLGGHLARLLLDVVEESGVVSPAVMDLIFPVSCERCSESPETVVWHPGVIVASMARVFQSNGVAIFPGIVRFRDALEHGFIGCESDRSIVVSFSRTAD